MMTAIPAAAFGADPDPQLNAAVDQALEDTAAYVYKTVKEPSVGSIGGEWAIIGLARSGYSVPDAYYENYYNAVEKLVKEKKGSLHDKKYTEYSRVSLALTAIGRDPRKVGGYNLLTPLGDFEKTVWQGINGPVWALVALDSGNYPMPENKAAKIQATRDMYIDEILKQQLPDGGFALLSEDEDKTKASADADITGMVLQALAKYQDKEKVKAAVEKALEALSKIQDEKGFKGHGGKASAESAVQVAVGLTELGVPLTDSRFVKNNAGIVDGLLAFYQKGKGFQHIAGDGGSLMATEQGLYALAAIKRARQGKNSLYRMSDAISTGGSAGTPVPPASAAGLPGKNADVKAREVVFPGKSFGDMAADKNRIAVEALAARGIISGKSENAFAPDEDIDRAEFAAIVVNALGLAPKAGGGFTDVKAGEWYAPYVGTASAYGIVSGTSAATFAPAQKITKQEAAAMISNAASLCGMNVKMTEGEVRDVISQFPDYVSSGAWARNALAFNYKENILSQDDSQIQPEKKMTRGEIAQMLYNMLSKAELLK